MEKKLGQEPAYPVDGVYAADAFKSNSVGMSKRFYAACAAMQGLLANTHVTVVNSKWIAEQSFIQADKLLKQEYVTEIDN